MTATPAATMAAERINRVIREGDEARKDCTTDAGKDYDQVIRPALLSLLQQTTREVTREELAEWWFMETACEKDNPSWERLKMAAASETESCSRLILRSRLDACYGKADRIIAKFRLSPRPVVSLVEG